MEKINTVKGTHDLFGEDQTEYDRIIKIFENYCKIFDYQKISTPIIEYSKVFQKTLGSTTDIVSKEMYSFEDISGDKITLRPEGTAPVTRAIISNSLNEQINQKFYYYGPMFRRERPQAGRLRQFHQFGVEIINSDSIFSDLENILVAEKILKKLEIRDMVHLQINTLGTLDCRKRFTVDLTKYFNKFRSDLSTYSKIRLEKNVMRILDSKDEKDKILAREAPKILNYLDKKSLQNYENIKFKLEELNINFSENINLVRGLDYYNHTAFEYVLKNKSGQNTILAGGRYDGLSKLIGGKEMSGVGWAAGIERIKMLVNSVNKIEEKNKISIFSTDEKLNIETLRVANQLSLISNIRLHCFFTGSLKKKMSKADKIFSNYALILGEEEFSQKYVILKDLQSGDQKKIHLENIFDHIKELFSET